MLTECFCSVCKRIEQFCSGDFNIFFVMKVFVFFQEAYLTEMGIYGIRTVMCSGDSQCVYIYNRVRAWGS